MDNKGRLEAIWIKPCKGKPMVAKAKATLLEGQGIDGNANQGGARQVTIISKEHWNEVAQEIGGETDPSTRRANLMVSGVELQKKQGHILKIGDVRVHIRGETKPCELMDQAHAGMKRALAKEWRGGIYGEVLDNGNIQIGDGITWERS